MILLLQRLRRVLHLLGRELRERSYFLLGAALLGLLP